MINKKVGLMKTPSLIGTILILLLFCAGTAVGATETISNTVCNAFYVVPAGPSCAQTFTPFKSGHINTIKLLVTPDYRQSPNGEVMVSIYAADAAGIPYGNPLATSDSHLVNKPLLFSDKLNDWTTFTFSTPAHVNSGAKYAFIVSSTNFLGIGCNESEVYINGVTYYDVYTNGDMLENYDSNWYKVDPATDLSFQIDLN